MVFEAGGEGGKGRAFEAAEHGQCMGLSWANSFMTGLCRPFIQATLELEYNLHILHGLHCPASTFVESYRKIYMHNGEHIECIMTSKWIVDRYRSRSRVCQKIMYTRFRLDCGVIIGVYSVHYSIYIYVE